MNGQVPEGADGDPGDGVSAVVSPGSRDALVAMLDHVNDGIVVVSADWRFRYLNEPAARLLRRPRHQLLGQPVRDYFGETGTAEYRRALDRCLHAGQPFTITEFYPPLGRWFESRGVPEGGEALIFVRDVTEQRRAEARLSEYGDRMAEAERIAHFGVWRWNLGSSAIFMSAELHAIYGVARSSALTGHELMELVHPDDRGRVGAQLRHARRTVEPFTFEHRIVRPDGTERSLYVRGRVVAGVEGTPEALVGVVHDVTEREQAERALGLNRRRMRALMDHSPSVISITDGDGRYVMVNAATAQLVGMAPEEMVGRHFESLFPSIAEQQLAADARARDEQITVFDEVVLEVDGEGRTFDTVTFPLPGVGGRLETCTIATDITARRELETERRRRLRRSAQIESAIADGRMLVHAQPILDIASGETVAHELLVRLRTEGPRGAVLPPAAFLPAAERFGIVSTIDRWMVDRALALATDVICPQVNLSAVTLSDPDARRAILDALRARPEAARRLVFEITETASAEQIGAAERFAAELTGLGCGLALDDFGTGYGSYTYLRRLPLRHLKIDRSFVARLGISPEDRRIVRSIVFLADSFGLSTTAEGVEDPEALTRLAQLGVHRAQGFHLGPPSPVAAPATGRTGEPNV
jgi:PAS domain S-box-containing protein